MKTFVCDDCGGTFPETEDEAAVQSEYEKNFTADERLSSPRAVVCDGCYADILKRRKMFLEKMAWLKGKGQ